MRLECRVIIANADSSQQLNSRFYGLLWHFVIKNSCGDLYNNSLWFQSVMKMCGFEQKGI